MNTEHDVKEDDVQEMTDTVIAQIAMTCHEANRAWCNINGDESQMPWDLAPEWQKTSAIAGVQMHLAHPNAGAQDSHESWYRQKAEDGWKYGKVKDPEKKLHPCMVTFEELPLQQQMKDVIFGAIAKGMIRKYKQAKALPQVLTRGMRQMNYMFNVGKNGQVDLIKEMCANLWDEMSYQGSIKNTQLHNKLQGAAKVSGLALLDGNGPAGLLSEAINEAGRNMSIAKTYLETAQMHAVKALTR